MKSKLSSLQSSITVASFNRSVFTIQTQLRSASMKRHFSSSMHTLKLTPSLSTLMSMPSIDPKLKVDSITPLQQQQITPKPIKDETAVERAIRDAKNAEQIQPIGDKLNTIPEPIKKKAPLSQRIKDELTHYWHGTKLLGKEIGISIRLGRKLLQGYKLSRREQRQVLF